VFERLVDEDFAYLTTFGRRTGRPHRIEIWFAVDGGRLYLLSGGGDRADWVKNIRKKGDVRIQVGTRTVSARARIARRGVEDQKARELLDAKYMAWHPKKKLSSWARGSTAVVIDLPR
jgi:deazaflavin-dependent oxidoreductase (nitroreductase family)